MNSEIKLLSVSTANVLGIVAGLSTEQLNKIPDGFANNLIWNVAHLLVTQKLLIYGLSGNDLGLDTEFVEKYRKGSKPEGVLTSQECEEILSLYGKQLELFKSDLANNKFVTFKEYPTSYNFEICNLNDAVAFNNLHYGLHVSTMLKLKKIVG